MKGMSTEREPLLSEDRIDKYAKLLFDTQFGRDTYFCGAIRARDHWATGGKSESP